MLLARLYVKVVPYGIAFFILWGKMQKHLRLSLYYIDLKYIRELHKIDEHVQSVSPQKGKARKPFLGLCLQSVPRENLFSPRFFYA